MSIFLHKLSAASICTPALLAALCLSPAAFGQVRDRDRDARDFDRDRTTRIDPGQVIPVRVNEMIDVERRDNRVYYGMVDQDVSGENGRLAIPRGLSVELIVRVTRGNDLILDLDSVTVNGQRYAIKADATRVESRRDDSLVGTI